MEKKVSIIVPIYNAEEYLDQCISSICQQTYENIEIILIDDCSVDMSSRICLKYQKQDKRIKILRHSVCQGVSKTRNDGIDFAEGNFLVFIDADDYIEQNFIDELMKGIDHKDIAVCGYCQFDPLKSWEKSYMVKEETLDWDSFFFHMFCTNVISGSVWNKMFRKEILGNIRFNVKLRVSEDYIFLMQYIEKCQSFSYIYKTLYQYRLNSKSITKKAQKQQYFDPKFVTVLDASDLMERSIGKEIYKGKEKFIKYRIVRGNIWLLLQMIYCNYYSKELGKRIKENIRKHYIGYRKVGVGKIIQNLAVAICLLSPTFLYFVATVLYSFLKETDNEDFIYNQ